MRTKEWIAKHGIALSIFSSIFSSIATVFATGAVKLLNPLSVAGLGSIIGGIILFFWAKSSGRLPSLKALKRNWKDVIVQIIFRTTVGHAMLLIGFSLTFAIKAVFFSKIEPFFVLLWGFLLGRERIYPRQVFILVVHLAGAFLLSTGGNIAVFTTAQLGDALIIGAMFLLAYTYYSGARLAKNIGVRSTTAITSLAGGSVNASLGFLLFPLGTLSSALGWIYFVGYMLTFHIIGITMWYAALKTVRGWIVSAVRAIGPIVGALLALALFGDMLTQVQIIGAAVILLTSALIVKEK